VHVPVVVSMMTNVVLLGVMVMGKMERDEADASTLELSLPSSSTQEEKCRSAEEEAVRFKGIVKASLQGSVVLREDGSLGEAGDKLIMDLQHIWKESLKTFVPDIKVVLFDVDDTIWWWQDTMERCFEAVNNDKAFANLTACKDLGDVYREVKKENPEMRNLPELLVKKSLERALPGISSEEVERLYGIWYDPWYEPTFFGNVVLALLVLKRQRRDLLLGVVTNGNAEISKIGKLHGVFDFTVTSETTGCGKPDRKIFEKAMEQARATCLKMEKPEVSGAPGVPFIFDPTCFLMIGDDLKNDIQGAQDVGIKACWVSREAKKHVVERPDGKLVVADYSAATVVEALNDLFDTGVNEDGPWKSPQSTKGKEMVLKSSK